MVLKKNVEIFLKSFKVVCTVVVVPTPYSTQFGARGFEFINRMSE